MKQTAKKVGAVPLKPLTEAQKKLIVEHIPFAKNLAKKYVGLVYKRGITLRQLETEACSALCEAAMRFTAEKGTDFKTYAFGWCKKFILAYIRDWGCNDYVDIENVKEDIPEDDEESHCERQHKVETMMAVLNGQELKVVRLLYGFDGDTKDFKEVAVIMNLHVGRVHQIYEKARTKMEFGLSPALPRREGVVNPLNF